MTEFWKNIPGFEDEYQASNLGRIKSLAKSYKTGKGYIRHVPDRIIGGNGLTPKGYKRVRIKTTTYLVHRLIALTWLPNTFNKEQINHIDGDKLNNNINNLEWSTNQENRDHAVKNDLIAYDNMCPFTKLSKEDVKEIREMYRSGKYSQKIIGHLYDVCQQTISRIVLGQSRLRFKDTVS